MKLSPEYVKESENEAKDKMLKNSFDIWTSYLLIKNSNQDKYGSLRKDLKQQYARKNDQYPTETADTKDILVNHPWDKTVYTKEKEIKKCEKEKQEPEEKKRKEKKGRKK